MHVPCLCNLAFLQCPTVNYMYVCNEVSYLICNGVIISSYEVLFVGVFSYEVLFGGSCFLCTFENCVHVCKLNRN